MRCVWRCQRGVSLPLYSSITLSSSIYLSAEREFIISCEGAAHDKHTGRQASRAVISLGMNERPHFDPTRGGKHMFCRFWLAGYLQRGLGIPPAGGNGRWRDGRGGGGGGSRSPCVYSALTLTWRGCWYIVLLTDMAAVLLNVFSATQRKVGALLSWHTKLGEHSVSLLTSGTTNRRLA